MRRETVKPTKPGNVVYDDLGRAIPKDGIELNYTTLISRSVKEGDLEIVKKSTKKGDK